MAQKVVDVRPGPPEVVAPADAHHLARLLGEALAIISDHLPAYEIWIDEARDALVKLDTDAGARLHTDCGV